MKLAKIHITLGILLSALLFQFAPQVRADEMQPGQADHGGLIRGTAHALNADRSARPREGGAEPLYSRPDARHIWEIGPEISHITYVEPAVMSQRGTMYGVGGAYRYRRGAVVKIEGNGSYGKVDYRNSGSIYNIDDIKLEIRALGGYDFRFSGAITVTPYIGIGYRYLRDDMAGRTTSTGEAGYLRESNYYYTPVGIEAERVFDGGWSAGVILEYDHFWKGLQRSYLSSAIAGYNDVENNQNGGYGLRGSVVVRKRTGRVSYGLEPFFRYWSIDKSDVQRVTYYGSYTGIVVWEPKNDSTEIGIRFVMGF